MFQPRHCLISFPLVLAPARYSDPRQLASLIPREPSASGRPSSEGLDPSSQSEAKKSGEGIIRVKT